MSRTWLHEGEHTAQSARGDKRVWLGHAVMWALTAAGGLVTYKSGGVGAGLAGAVLGNRFGYRIAPHERQARKRAGQTRKGVAQVTSQAITRHNH
jgi:hypothetical protein